MAEISRFHSLRLGSFQLGISAMHKSRLGGIVIDCNSDDYERDVDFWSGALGLDAVREAEDPRYVDLRGDAARVGVLVQKVDHPSRVHLDIETDDCRAEVARLEALGAKQIADIRDWTVMEAPSGHRFCVVPADGGQLAADANQWNED